MAYDLGGPLPANLRRQLADELFFLRRQIESGSITGVTIITHPRDSGDGPRAYHCWCQGTVPSDLVRELRSEGDRVEAYAATLSEK